MNHPRVRVGVPQSGYNVQRNITGSCPEWAITSRPVDIYRVRTGLRYRIGFRSLEKEMFSFCDPYWGPVDILHFFNTVAKTSTPWVTTFEEMIPRWHGARPATRLKGVRCMLSPACKRLIAFSDAARHTAFSDWSDILPANEATALMQKTQVLLPPQAMLCAFEDKPLRCKPRFLFAGRAFYRKGGLETLEAFHRLLLAHVTEWSLDIVGDLDSLGDYASQAGPPDRHRAVELLRLLGDHVSFAHNASYQEVLQRMKEADYYLLPTLGDTFGYSALEAQACGAIVIGTNVSSLPEILGRDRGILIPLPIDDRRTVHGRADIARVRAHLVDQLEDVLKRCLATDRHSRQATAENAYRSLAAHHSPESHRAALGAIYVTCLMSCET
jgi:glycosyltransferase involved in cell wall biosynthesis